MDKILNKIGIKEFCKVFPAVKLLYLFGSRARQESGAAGDYDFAVYLDKKNHPVTPYLKVDLISYFAGKLKTDGVDVVIMNDTDSPVLKAEIVYGGKLLYEEEPYRLLVEPRIMDQYTDYKLSFADL